MITQKTDLDGFLDLGDTVILDEETDDDYRRQIVVYRVALRGV